MQTSPEAGSFHHAIHAGALSNNHDPDLNANGPVTSECSVPTSYVSLEVIKERYFLPVAQRSHESTFSYTWNFQNIWLGYFQLSHSYGSQRIIQYWKGYWFYVVRQVSACNLSTVLDF